METPVAFFIFNRPKLTETVFNVIRQVKPRTLLIVADGPRSAEEKIICDQARAIVKNIDWECRLGTNFSDTNLGCRNRVSSGLDWVFDQVEEAIIIEDDCLPGVDFFRFCELMLERYRDEKQVMMIDGFHLEDGIKREDSYYFSKYPEIWGWASWRRAWQLYDVDMKTWPEFRNSKKFARLFDDDFVRLHWQDTFESTYMKRIDTWDYQLVYACLIHNGLSIKPSVNLVKNLGFSESGTHHKSYNPFLAELSVGALGELRHPSGIHVDPRADKYGFDHCSGGKEMRSSWASRFRAWSLSLRGR